MIPFKHQIDAKNYIINNDGRGAIFHSIGMGKTKTVLDIYTELRKREYLKLVVICPLSLIEGAWGEDIQKFTTYKYKDLHEKRKSRQTKGPRDILIANYEWLLHNDIPNPGNDVMMIALDESSKLKNNKSRITKKLLSMRTSFKYRVIMTGTPAPNNESEYWAQMRFINDNIFHKSFYAFKNEFFVFQRGTKSMQGTVMCRSMMQELFKKGWKLGINKLKQKELADKMKPWCHYAKKEDCLDLPDRVNEKRLIEMHPTQARIYKEMKKECIAEIKGKEIIATVALTKIMKLRQITSGFAIDAESIAHPIGVNPKFNELFDVLESAGDQQVIIWGVFHYEIDSILEKLGDKAVSLYGKTKDRQLSIEKFKAGEAQYLVAHPKSAAHGLTFVNSSLQIFYSLDYSYELYEQAKGRTHRPGQVNKCTYIHLLCKDSIDIHVYDVLQRKGEATEIINRFLNE